MNNKEAHAREFAKFKDDAVTYREREAAMANLHFSTFIASVGPLGIGLMKVTGNLPTGAAFAWILLATAPLGFLLTLINWARTPKDYRGAKPVLKAVLFAVVLAVTTLVLSQTFTLTAKAPAAPPPSVVE